MNAAPNDALGSWFSVGLKALGKVVAAVSHGSSSGPNFVAPPRIDPVIAHAPLAPTTPAISPLSVHPAIDPLAINPVQLAQSHIAAPSSAVDATPITAVAPLPTATPATPQMVSIAPPSGGAVLDPNAPASSSGISENRILWAIGLGIGATVIARSVRKSKRSR